MDLSGTNFGLTGLEISGESGLSSILKGNKMHKDSENTSSQCKAKFVTLPSPKMALFANLEYER